MIPLTSIRLQGGNVLGNGTWLNVGGNQAVTYGGLTAHSQNGGAPYDDPDGGKRYDSLLSNILDVLTSLRSLRYVHRFNVPFVTNTHQGSACLTHVMIQAVIGC